MSTVALWRPFQGLSSLFDDAGSEASNSEPRFATWAPAVDIFESEGELVAKADLPGLEEKDIDVRVENNVLTVGGERKFEKNVTADNYLRVERTYGSFTRSFSLPDTINSEQIQATYDGGVLTVRMPKREESKPKQIKVGVSAEKAK